LRAALKPRSCRRDALTNNWLIKAEYLYADLGTNRVQLRTSLGGDADVSLKQHVGRVGLNYKF
jgi:opacity protein-like surface antigen